MWCKAVPVRHRLMRRTLSTCTHRTTPTLLNRCLSTATNTTSRPPLPPPPQRTVSTLKPGFQLSTFVSTVLRGTVVRINDASTMSATLNSTGDYLLTSRTAQFVTQPHALHADLILLQNSTQDTQTNADEMVCRRVVALSGDVVRLQVPDYKSKSNIKLIDIVIPHNHAFVCADGSSTAATLDSRTVGPIDLSKHMCGRVKAVLRKSTKAKMYDRVKQQMSYDWQSVESADTIKRTDAGKLIEQLDTSDSIAALFAAVKASDVQIRTVYIVPRPHRPPFTFIPTAPHTTASASTSQLNDSRRKLINSVHVQHHDGQRYRSRTVLLSVFAVAFGAIAYRNITADKTQPRQPDFVQSDTDDAVDSEKHVSPTHDAQQRRISRYLTIAVVSAVTLQIVSKLWHSSVVFMSGRSMLPTLRESGEYLLVNRFAHLRSTSSHKWRNSVVLVHNPEYSTATQSTQPSTFCKRVIGVAGDTVQMRRYGDNTTVDVVIPSDYMFVIGDNQSESVDSRAFGPIDMRQYLYASAMCRLPRHSTNMSLRPPADHSHSVNYAQHTPNATGSAKRLEQRNDIAAFFEDPAELHKQQYVVDTVYVNDSAARTSARYPPALLHVKASTTPPVANTPVSNDNSSGGHSQRQRAVEESVFSLRFVLRVLRYVLYMYIFKRVAFDIMPCTGQSMEPTIAHSGEYLLVNKFMLIYKYLNQLNHTPANPIVSRNDVVIVRSPLESARHMCKRVVAVAGDVVRLGLIDTPIYIDIVIPPGYIFALGDNQRHSIDSRMFGPIHLNNALYGRVVCKVSQHGVHGVTKVVSSDVDDIPTSYVDSVDQVDMTNVALRAVRPDQIAMMFDTANESRKSSLFVKHVYAVNGDNNNKHT